MATIKQLKYAAIARRHGIRNALPAIEEGAKLGIGPALAVAMMEQESGGRNVWGHDPTIFVGGYDSLHLRFWTSLTSRRGYVNEAGYKEYKRQRGAAGRGGQQGVGPCQLTYFAIQDAADRAGGCWKPRVNIRTGFTTLAALIREYGTWGGLRRYNGSGARAAEYANSVIAKRNKWRERFGIHA